MPARSKWTDRTGRKESTVPTGRTDRTDRTAPIVLNGRIGLSDRTNRNDLDGTDKRQFTGG
ncbi:MAG: hypothetical protein HP497_03025 [Nitrospira sp.]|nr:hypothetical protein [Nitrospira sp.]